MKNKEEIVDLFVAIVKQIPLFNGKVDEIGLHLNAMELYDKAYRLGREDYAVEIGILTARIKKEYENKRRLD